MLLKYLERRARMPVALTSLGSQTNPLYLSEEKTPPSSSHYFFYAQKLPLKRKFEGFRSFGLFGAVTTVVLLLPVWVISQWHAVSIGLKVSLLKQSSLHVSNDSLTKPIVLTIIDVGLNKPPEIGMNSKLVPWSDMESELKKEIAQRPPGAIVYIGGDENIPWADVVFAVDIARGLQAKVVLLTTPPLHGISKSQ